jgi:ElaB/YqjD/DUF883 family membrane-anchored ribosome-binding protein
MQKPIMNAESNHTTQPDAPASDHLVEELGSLKKDYAKLLADHAELAAMVEKLAADKDDASNNDATQNIRDEADKIRDRVNELHSKISSTVSSREEDIERVKDHIGRHPLTTVMAAFAFGYLIARILGLGGRR